MIESKLFQIVKYIMMGVAVLELAVSQIHIAAISLLSIREIGFFLFLFIFSSIILMAILSSFNEWNLSNVMTTLLSGLAAGGTGLYTVLLFLSDTKVAFESISVSLIFMVVGVVVFFVGTGLLLVAAQRNHKG